MNETLENDQTPIRFASAEEFRARPNWTEVLDHGGHKLARIVGDYDLPRDAAVHCGLQSCRTLHQRGYVVATESGLETNIGSVCGKKHFRVEWGEIETRHKRAAAERDRQLWREKIFGERAAMLSHATKVADSLTKADGELSRIWERLSKEKSVDAALRDAYRAGGAIRVGREVSAVVAALMNSGASRRRELQTIGRIEGLGLLLPNPSTGRRESQDLLSQLRGNVLPRLRILQGESLDGLSRRERESLDRDLEAARLAIDRAGQLLYSLEAFFRPENLRQIGRIEPARVNDRTRRTLAAFARGDFP